MQWRPPDGMTAQIHAFNGREGGSFRMSLTYTGPDHVVRGRTSENVDAVFVRFVIPPDVHEAAIASTLRRLAAFTE